MKREQAFAFKARSQFSSFSGRTRKSKTSPAKFAGASGDRKIKNPTPEKPIEEVCVNRRSKRVENVIPVADLGIVDESEVPAAAVAEIVNAGGRIPAPEEVGVSRKRFTRSALVGNNENVEESGALTRKNLEFKMSKKIGLGRIPINLRGLLETGVLEGFRVYYDFDTEGKNLQGIIKGVGILCSCSLCEGTKVISPSQFELHACKQYRHAIKHTRLENGKSLLEVIEICKASASDSVEVALQTVISSLPVKGPSKCTKCNGLIDASSTENLLVCDSCVGKKQVEGEPCIVTRSQVRASSLDPKESTEVTENLLVCDSRVNKKQVEGEPSATTRGQVRSITVVNKKKRGRPRKYEVTSSSSITFNIKRKRGRPRKSAESALKPVTSAGKFKVSGNKRDSKILERSPRPIKSATKCTSSQQKSGTKPTMKNLQLHGSVFLEGGLPDGTELSYFARGKKVQDGYKSGNGIFCYCCNAEISASQFEAHAGWASRKKPYENIFMSNGVSLHEYAVSLKKNESGSYSEEHNDNVCGVCQNGGNLLLCDGCPRSFHKKCVGEPSIPDDKWYCRCCEHSYKVDRESANALAAGRVTGVDPLKQIKERCVRTIEPSKNSDLSACFLCRCHDFSKNVFNDRTVIVCDQCEKEYHIGCLREHKLADLKKLPKGDWFCCKDCERINSVLKTLIAREPEALSDDMLTFLRKKQKKKNSNNNSESDSNPEMKFVVLRGKNATRENRKWLAQTVDIFHEGFDPIVDAASGRDFIPSMVHGRKIWSQDFAGMLCAILIIDSNVVTAGTLRVFDENIAELPIVATRKSNQGKGYFQVLFSCIEKLLSSMKIKKIVLPAAEEAKSIWTEKFGFETIAPDQLNELRKSCSAVMTFQGTSMLQKEVLQG